MTKHEQNACLDSGRRGRHPRGHPSPAASCSSGIAAPRHPLTIQQDQRFRELQNYEYGVKVALTLWG